MAERFHLAMLSNAYKAGVGLPRPVQPAKEVGLPESLRGLWYRGQERYIPAHRRCEATCHVAGCWPWFMFSSAVTVCSRMASSHHPPQAAEPLQTPLIA